MESEQARLLRVREEKWPYGEQDEWGNSVATLRVNLKLTMFERLQKAEDAARSIQELNRALKRTS